MAGVVICRPRERADSLRDLLVAAGYEVRLWPTIRIVPLSIPARLISTVIDPERCLGVVFVSVNAVRYGLRQLDGEARDRLKTLPVLAVGEATRRELGANGIAVYGRPEKPFNSEALLNQDLLSDPSGRHVVIFRGRGGRELLARSLRRRGAHVDYLECYERHPPEENREVYSRRLLEFAPRFIVLSSNNVAENFFALLTRTARALTPRPELVVFSQRQKDYCESRSRWPIRITAEPSDQAVLDCIREACRS